MKRLIAFALSLFMVIMPIPVQAEETTEPTMFREIILDNDIRIVEEIFIDTTSRSSERTATRTESFYRSDSLIAVIAYKATFRYDGSSVSVVSKSVTQTDTYSGWSYTQESFTSSGGTVTLTGKLKYLLIFSTTTFTMSMTCDANGNISF